MHEVSIAYSIIEKLKETAKGRKVKKVKIEIGEFIVLNKDQLKFLLDNLKKQQSWIKDAIFEINTVDGIISCKCGYKGKSLRDNHIALPICPKCYEKAEVLQGNELKVKEIILS